MIAIVTDRPNVGREIARVLGADRKENGYMTGNGYMVTWTYGNMLSLAMPKDSGTARVEWKDFPLLPPSFLTVRHVKTDTGWNPDINALLQLKIIAKVLNACDTIIAATDASREGEMLFRHLLKSEQGWQLDASGAQTTLPPPLDLVSDGRGHHGRHGEPPSM